MVLGVSPSDACSRRSRTEGLDVCLMQTKDQLPNYLLLLLLPTLYCRAPQCS